MIGPKTFPDNVLVVLQLEEITRDKLDPQIIASFLERGFVMDGDYYRIIYKDDFYKQLLEKKQK